MCSAQPGQQETVKRETEKKFSLKKLKHSSKNEKTVRSVDTVQIDEGTQRKEKKQGCWRWAHKKKSSRVEEEAAGPVQAGQQ